VRVGRYGPYVEEALNGLGTEGPDAVGNGSAGSPAVQPRRATITDDVAPDELTPARARELLEQASDEGRVLGFDPATGYEILARAGRYGPYVTEVLPDQSSASTELATDTDAAEALSEQPQPPAKTKGKAAKAAKVKPRTASLFKDMDLATIELPTALRLLSLPRVVGTDAEGVEITAQNGRYGPYLKRGTDSRSLQSEQQLFDITLEEAVAIYAQPKMRGGRGAAAAPLKELGPDPASGRPVVVKDGRFGPYVTDGETNATLRKSDDPESITPERAFELLADKRERGPAPRKRAAKKTSAAKPATSKKTTKTAPRKQAATSAADSA